MGHDDALFAGLAGELVDRQWLGPYHGLTLAKGPTYPIFVAAAYTLHLPLLVADQLVHLIAAAVVALAAWRVSRSRWLGIAAYVVIALDPTYFGALGSRVSRETLYESLGLLLAGGTILLLAIVPALLARGLRWAVPVLASAGASLGVVGAAYYMCRDERFWIGPTVALAAVAGAATWRFRDRGWRSPALATAAAAVVGAGAFLTSVHWVTARNETHYGAAIVSDLVDGEIARAYAQWQRVDVGKHRRLVPVSADQRWAVYQISPGAAELAGWLDGPPGWAWFSFSCRYGICDDYAGAYFVWAMRGAAVDTGHMDSGDEGQRFFGRIADDIEAACREDLPCSPAGLGPLPPSYQFNVDDVTDGAWRASAYFLTLNFASPERPFPSAGSDDEWAAATRALRGVDKDRHAHLAFERRAADDQWPVTALAWLYRWGGRLGGVVALTGLAVGVVTRAGRRRAPVVIAAVAMLAAVAGRILFVALLDATAYPAARNGRYLLPGVGFYVLFVTFGSWVLMTVVRGWWRARQEAGAAAAAAPTPEAPRDTGDAADDTRAAAPEGRPDTTLVGR